MSERALVKVDGQWYDIYDTKLLNPLSSPTKKFAIDFNKKVCKDIKATRSTKNVKKKYSLGLALILYGSPGGKGCVSMKKRKEDIWNNQNLALITPEKSQDDGKQTTDENDMSKRPKTAT